MSRSDESSGSTIGEVAMRTGTTVEQLRTWERRYGFPRPARDSAGRRRYDETTIGRVADVAARRASGQSVGAAIDAVHAEAPARPSLFRAVRDTELRLDAVRLRVPAMRALSHAIEDACLARPGDGVLLGAFQRASRFTPVAARWEDLSRSVTTAVAYADFADPAPTAIPARVHIPDSSPMRSEWAVVCRTRAVAACLVGWERPADGHPIPARSFEALWTTDADVVAVAIDALADLTETVDESLADRIRRPLGPHGSNRAAADELTARAVRYLERP